MSRAQGPFLFWVEEVKSDFAEVVVAEEVRLEPKKAQPRGISENRVGSWAP